MKKKTEYPTEEGYYWVQSRGSWLMLQVFRGVTRWYARSLDGKLTVFAWLPGDPCPADARWTKIEPPKEDWK